MSPPDTPRFDHDPVSGAPKNLLLEESRTNSVRKSNEFTNAAWGRYRVAATSSTDFPTFASGKVFLLTGNGVSGNRVTGCNFPQFTTPFKLSIFTRRDFNNFAQLKSYTDTTIWANYDLLTGQTGNISADIIATFTPWRDGMFRCTMTASSA